MDTAKLVALIRLLPMAATVSSGMALPAHAVTGDIPNDPTPTSRYEQDALTIARQLRTAFAAGDRHRVQSLIQVMIDCSVRGLNIGGNEVGFGDLGLLNEALSQSGPVLFVMDGYLTAFSMCPPPREDDRFPPSSIAIAR
jgi:hypothetical protein